MQIFDRSAEFVLLFHKAGDPDAAHRVEVFDERRAGKRIGRVAHASFARVRLSNEFSRHRRDGEVDVTES